MEGATPIVALQLLLNRTVFSGGDGIEPRPSRTGDGTIRQLRIMPKEGLGSVAKLDPSGGPEEVHVRQRAGRYEANPRPARVGPREPRPAKPPCPAELGKVRDSQPTQGVRSADRTPVDQRKRGRRLPRPLLPHPDESAH